MKRTKANGLWTGGRGHKSLVPRNIREQAWRRQFSQTHPDYYRGVQLLKLYGITREEYNEMLVRQGNRCAVCRQHETVVDPRSNKIRELAVDHNHQTKRVRGLLCDRCNRGLGMLDDDPVRLRTLARYVEENGV